FVPLDVGERFVLERPAEDGFGLAVPPLLGVEHGAEQAEGLAGGAAVQGGLAALGDFRRRPPQGEPKPGLPDVGLARAPVEPEPARGARWTTARASRYPPPRPPRRAAPAAARAGRPASRPPAPMPAATKRTPATPHAQRARGFGRSPGAPRGTVLGTDAGPAF